MKGKSSIELKEILHKDLLLLVTPSCFFFFVLDSISKKVISYTSFKSIDKLVDFELSFDSVSVYVLNDKFTTLPSALFSEDKAKEYLAFTTTLSENSLVFYDHVLLEKLIVIWSLDKALKNKITKIYSGAKFKSVFSPFIGTTNSIASKNKISSLFFEDRLIISVVKNGVLEIVNTFEIKSIEDALYYHLLLFQSTALNEEDIEIITGGVFKELDLFLEKLSIYFSNVTRIVSTNNLEEATADQSFLEIVTSIN